MKNCQIYCEVSAKDSSKHEFYLKYKGENYYLFMQDYKKGVNDYYEKGVTIDDAINFSKIRKDASLRRTADKIISYVRYIEKEYDLAILRRTIMKQAQYA